MTQTTTNAGETVSPAVREAIRAILAINARFDALNPMAPADAEFFRLLDAKVALYDKLETLTGIGYFDLIKAVNLLGAGQHSPIAATVREILAEGTHE